jgi:hypothetical protein
MLGLGRRGVYHCEVYWTGDFCALSQGHAGPHVGTGTGKPAPEFVTLAGPDAPAYSPPDHRRRLGRHS